MKIINLITLLSFLLIEINCKTGTLNATQEVNLEFSAEVVSGFLKNLTALEAKIECDVEQIESDDPNAPVETQRIDFVFEGLASQEEVTDTTFKAIYWGTVLEEFVLSTPYDIDTDPYRIVISPDTPIFMVTKTDLIVPLDSEDNREQLREAKYEISISIMIPFENLPTDNPEFQVFLKRPDANGKRPFLISLSLENIELTKILSTPLPEAISSLKVDDLRGYKSLKTISIDEWTSHMLTMLQSLPNSNLKKVQSFNPGRRLREQIKQNSGKHSQKVLGSESKHRKLSYENMADNQGLRVSRFLKSFKSKLENTIEQEIHNLSSKQNYGLQRILSLNDKNIGKDLFI